MAHNKILKHAYYDCQQLLYYRYSVVWFPYLFYVNKVYFNETGCHEQYFSANNRGEKSLLYSALTVYLYKCPQTVSQDESLSEDIFSMFCIYFSRVIKNLCFYFERALSEVESENTKMTYLCLPKQIIICAWHIQGIFTLNKLSKVPPLNPKAMIGCLTLSEAWLLF